MISDDFLQELKFKADIVDIISTYVKLKPSGHSLTGLCPFHSEKTPSFVVDKDKALFHCFGCGAGGDVITFIRKIENLDYISALKFISDKVGLSMPQDDIIHNKNAELRLKILEINRLAARFFYRNLHTDVGKEALKYLIQRGLTPQTIRKFGLGFANTGNNLSLYLKNKGYSKEVLIAANLSFKSKNSNSLVDRFRNRIIFPIIGCRSNVLAFGGRRLADQGPKYLNTSDTPVFKKRANLYSLNFAQKSPENFFILTEGYMDVISLAQAGFSSAVATLGTSLTPDQAKLMSRFKDQVVISYDADNAGVVATNRAIPILKDASLSVKVLNLGESKDPDEYIKNNGKNAAAKFKNLLMESQNSSDYSLDKIRRKYNLEEINGKINYLNDSVRFLLSLDNRIERDLYASKLASELGVYKDNILAQLKKEERKHKRYQKYKQENYGKFKSNSRDVSLKNGKFVISRAVAAEKALLAEIIDSKSLNEELFNMLDPQKIENDLIRKIYENIKSRYENGRNFGMIDLSQDLSNEEMAFVSDLICNYSLALDHDNGDNLHELANTINSEFEKRTFCKEGKIEDEKALNLYLNKLKNEKI